jgi:hypothetical protein
MTEPARRQEMTERANGRRTVPQIFIGDTHVGGYDDLSALDRAGPARRAARRLMRAALVQISERRSGENGPAAAALVREAAAGGAGWS